MNIKSIINNLKNKGIYLFKDGNNIRCRASKRVMTDDIRNQIRQHKKEILKLLIIENTYNLPVKISKAKFTHRICHQLLKLIEGILKLLGTGNPYNSPVKRPRTKPIQNNLPTNGSMIRLIQGDCLDALKNIEDDSVDQLVTDPPYGYKFMGKDWDKAVPSVEIWKECFRVLKPGAFAFVMSAPRQDVLNQMITNLSKAGFNTNFTSLYWTYANGFPKAHNISKAIDKKLGAKREVINERTMPDQDTIPATPEARQLDGAYAGFQPKPAVEIILFHGTRRCNSCIVTGQLLDEVLHTYYSGEVANGTITFREVNAETDRKTAAAYGVRYVSVYINHEIYPDALTYYADHDRFVDEMRKKIDEALLNGS